MQGASRCVKFALKYLKWFICSSCIQYANLDRSTSSEIYKSSKPKLLETPPNETTIEYISNNFYCHYSAPVIYISVWYTFCSYVYFCWHVRIFLRFSKFLNDTINFTHLLDGLYQIYFPKILKLVTPVFLTHWRVTSRQYSGQCLLFQYLLFFLHFC